MRWRSPSPAETREAGRALGTAIGASGATVALTGPLGAGKTLFAKGVAEGIGIAPGLLASPTFVIAQELPAPGGRRLVHADLYRVESEAELEEVGLRDWLAVGVVLLVEWADRLPGALPDDRLEVRLAHVEGAPEARELEARAHGAAAAALRQRWLAGAAAPLP